MIVSWKKTSRSRIALAALWSLLVVPLPVAAAEEAPSPSGRTSAATSFRRGVDLYKEGDFGGALAEFHRAHRISPHPRALFNIYKAQWGLRHYPEALSALEELTEPSKGALHVFSEQERADIEVQLEKVRGRVGTLQILSPGEGAEVRLDDHVVGRTPFAAPLRVGVGQHRLSVQFEGQKALERDIEVAGGDELVVNVDLPSPQITATSPNALRADVQPDLSAPAPAPVRLLPNTFANGGGALVLSGLLAFALLGYALFAGLARARTRMLSHATK